MCSLASVASLRNLAYRLSSAATPGGPGLQCVCSGAVQDGAMRRVVRKTRRGAATSDSAARNPLF
eukprot:320347-Pleurochrysis_carterae.AAC.1